MDCIIVSGYHVSTITAPAGIPVDKMFFNAGNAYIPLGIRWPNDTGGGDTPAMVQGAEEKTGLKMTSFSGCYTGKSFTMTD